MKRLTSLLSLLVALLVVQSASAWGRLGHATVAYIAEQHLTPSAKAALDDYLQGKSIVYYASWLDDYKPQMLVDLGYDPEKGHRLHQLPHTFSVDASGEVVRGNRWPGTNKYLANCTYYIEESADLLKNHIHELDDSTRLARIQLIVHCVGDMHCPGHFRYPGNTGIGYFDVTFFDETIRYHTIWDTPILTRPHPWSFSDLAWLIDRYTASEQQVIASGDVYDWGRESVALGRSIYDVQPGDKLDNEFVKRFKPLAESQLAKAGDRLAALLNDIFSE
jgi:hypothetical protein